jgi:hypothetical protein
VRPTLDQQTIICWSYVLVPRVNSTHTPNLFNQLIHFLVGPTCTPITHAAVTKTVMPKICIPHTSADIHHHVRLLHANNSYKCKRLSRAGVTAIKPVFSVKLCNQQTHDRKKPQRTTTYGDKQNSE